MLTISKEMTGQGQVNDEPDKEEETRVSQSVIDACKEPLIGKCYQ